LISIPSLLRKNRLSKSLGRSTVSVSVIFEFLQLG
jgi:hypothetical protein